MTDLISRLAAGEMVAPYQILDVRKGTPPYSGDFEMLVDPNFSLVDACERMLVGGVCMLVNHHDLYISIWARKQLDALRKDPRFRAKAALPERAP